MAAISELAALSSSSSRSQRQPTPNGAATTLPTSIVPSRMSSTGPSVRVGGEQVAVVAKRLLVDSGG